jgi:hypothetical protein
VRCSIRQRPADQSARTAAGAPALQRAPAWPRHAAVRHRVRDVSREAVDSSHVRLGDVSTAAIESLSFEGCSCSAAHAASLLPRSLLAATMCSATTLVSCRTTARCAAPAARATRALVGGAHMGSGKAAAATVGALQLRRAAAQRQQLRAGPEPREAACAHKAARGACCVACASADGANEGAPDDDNTKVRARCLYAHIYWQRAVSRMQPPWRAHAARAAAALLRLHVLSCHLLPSHIEQPMLRTRERIPS